VSAPDSARIIERVLDEFRENQDKPITDPSKAVFGPPLPQQIVTALREAGVLVPDATPPSGADPAMAALYRQLDSEGLPGDPPFDTEAGLSDFAARAEAAQGALDEHGTLAQALDRLLAVIATAPQLPRAALASCRLCRNHVLYLLDTRESYGTMKARVRSLTYAHESHPRDPALAASHADASPPRIRGMQP
jgi:hypothetical protein